MSIRVLAVCFPSVGDLLVVEFVTNYISCIDNGANIPKPIQVFLHRKEDVPYQKSSCKSQMEYASDLIEFIKEEFGNHFCIGVAGYPEKYPRSKSKQEDIDNIKYKVSLGANFIITQGCFTYKGYSEFVKICRSNDVSVPIYCGIFLPNIFSLPKFNGITYPDEVINPSTDISDLNTEENMFSQIKKLMRSLYDDCLNDGIHIFTINDVMLCKRMFHELGIRSFRT